MISAILRTTSVSAASPSRSPKGLIIGVTIGCLVAICVLIGAILTLRRRRRTGSQMPRAFPGAELESEDVSNDMQPSNSASNLGTKKFPFAMLRALSVSPSCYSHAKVT
jgi:hypothetical protein